MIISIAIADANRDYIERFAEGLQQYNDLSISVFTSSQKLLKAIENRKYDIVLFDPDISKERLPVSNVKLAICLYSDESVNSGMYADIDNVLKYQRISNIYKEILKKYAEKAGYSAELNHSQRTKMLAVYSPIGGSGKTLLSIAIANKMVERGKNVLYISTEQLSSSAALFQYKEEGNTALIEALSRKAVFELKLRGIAKKGINGIFYIEGFERIVDFNDVTIDEMLNILKNIRKCGIYQNVVIDMDSTVGDIVKAIFEEADDILVINKPGVFASKKMQMFANQGLVIDNKSKMVKVNNFADNNSKYNNELDVPEVGIVRNHRNQEEQRVIQIINMNNEIEVSKFL